MEKDIPTVNSGIQQFEQLTNSSLSLEDKTSEDKQPLLKVFDIGTIAKFT